MHYSFKGVMTPPWTLTDAGITIKNQTIKLSDIQSMKVANVPNNALTNGVIQIWVGGKVINLGFGFKEKAAALEAIAIMEQNYGSDEIKARNEAKREKAAVGLIYDLKGVRGRSMRVYDDRCVIKVQAGVGSFLTGNVSDGEKTIYYADCIGVQFKESGVQIGYLQLETASAMMNNKNSNFFNENSFTFDISCQSNEHMAEVADYVRQQVSAAKHGAAQPTVVNQTSAADEILKFKSLLDMGVLTQEEFDAKKKELLGL